MYAYCQINKFTSEVQIINHVNVNVDATRSTSPSVRLRPARDRTHN